MMDALNSVRETDDPDPDDQGWTARRVVSLVCLVMVCEGVGLGYSMISLGLPSIIALFRTDQGGWLLRVVYLETGFRYGLFLAAGIALVAIVVSLTVLRTRDALPGTEPAVAAVGS